jgi:hydroxymethylbilane synthase
MTPTQQIQLGTRGSELALAQTEIVTQLLQTAHPQLEVERTIITTTGDKRQDLRLADVAASSGGVVDKGIFIKELEVALEDRRIDAAVHSLKDMPSELEGHFTLAAILTRARIEDVLISSKQLKGVQDLPQGARVGTSSVRRARQLQWMRPDLQIVEIRGNVPTRVRKVVGEGALDAVMLAAAGLVRLGLLDEAQSMVHLDGKALHAAVLPPEIFLPAAGQGAIAIQTLASNEAAREYLAALNDEITSRRVLAEREFLRLLGAGCQTPVGVHTWHDAGHLSMKVRLFDETTLSATPVEVEETASIETPLALAKKIIAKLRG